MDCQKLIIYGLVALVGLYFLREACGIKLPFIDNVEGFLGLENIFENNEPTINGNVNTNNNAVLPSNNNAVLPSTTGQKVSPSEEHGDESFLRVNGINRSPTSCFPQNTLKPDDLLPADKKNDVNDFNKNNPISEGILKGVNFLEAGYQVGVNTVGQSLRNSNQQLRSEPANPQVNVSPWQNTTIGPDLGRRPLEAGEDCYASVNSI